MTVNARKATPASSVELITCCPKCRGRSGYVFKKILRHTCTGYWVEPEDSWTPKEKSVDAEQISRSKTVTCLDCGKRINGDLL